ncbi:MAG TPA: hypothetical protein VII73_11595, partial [Caulobacteraceae bacterium]
AALGLAGVCGAGAIGAFAQAAPKRAAPSAAAAPAPPLIAQSSVALGMNADGPSQEAARAMNQMHLTVCRAQVQKALDFIFEGQPAKFIAQPLGPDSDRWPTVFVIESGDPAGGHSRLSTLMVSPNCAGMYEQVIYWNAPCTTIKATVFAAYGGEHRMLRDVAVSESGPALQIYLTTAGAGCLSVKKELFR